MLSRFCPASGGRVGRRTRQLVLAAVLGSLMSGVALAFIRPIEYGFAAFGQAAGRASWLLVVIPALGGLVSGWLYELLRTPGEGKGVSRVMWSIYRKRGRLPALEGLHVVGFFGHHRHGRFRRPRRPDCGHRERHRFTTCQTVSSPPTADDHPSWLWCRGRDLQCVQHANCWRVLRDRGHASRFVEPNFCPDRGGGGGQHGDYPVGGRWSPVPQDPRCFLFPTRLWGWCLRVVGDSKGNYLLLGLLCGQERPALTATIEL